MMPAGVALVRLEGSAAPVRVRITSRTSEKPVADRHVQQMCNSNR